MPKGQFLVSGTDTDVRDMLGANYFADWPGISSVPAPA